MCGDCRSNTVDLFRGEPFLAIHMCEHGTAGENSGTKSKREERVTTSAGENSGTKSKTEECVTTSGDILIILPT